MRNKSSWLTAECLKGRGARICQIGAIFINRRANDIAPRIILYFTPDTFKFGVHGEDTAGLFSAFGTDLTQWIGRRVALTLVRTAAECAASTEPYTLAEIHRGRITCTPVAASEAP